MGNERVVQFVTVILSVLLYVCLGLGITRIKIANNKRAKARWERIHPVAKVLATILEPLMAVYRGWETAVLVIAALVMGGELNLEPDDDGDEHDV